MRGREREMLSTDSCEGLVDYHTMTYPHRNNSKGNAHGKEHYTNDYERNGNMSCTEHWTTGGNLLLKPLVT